MTQTLLEKLMLCAAGAAEHFVDVSESEDYTRGREAVDAFHRQQFAAWENLRAAVAAVKAQRKFLEDSSDA